MFQTFPNVTPFLSIQAQDFIEERSALSAPGSMTRTFLSIQAQDFIEEPQRHPQSNSGHIPEHSSSGLH